MKNNIEEIDDLKLVDFVPVTLLYRHKILSRYTMHYLFKDKKLGHYKIGDRSYVSREEFNALFKRVN